MSNYAQTVMSEDELKRYFEKNILSLQPLEGIYYVKNTTNLFFKDETHTYTRAFIFSAQKNSYEELCFNKNTGKFEYLQQIQYDSSTHVFRYTSTNNQHIVYDPSHFTLKHNLQTSYDNDEYIRLYPTDEMLAETKIESKINHACDLIENKFFSSAIAILDDVLKTREGPREYYYRASAYYGLKDLSSAIRDCNKALSYSIKPENATMIYYLRGLCYFLIEDKDSGISDMEKAGEDGSKFLEEFGYTKAQSAPKQNSNKTRHSTTKNKTPLLKKTK